MSPKVYDLSRKIATIKQKMGSTPSITAFNNLEIDDLSYVTKSS